jgi:hypothetical protein
MNAPATVINALHASLVAVWAQVQAAVPSPGNGLFNLRKGRRTRLPQGPVPSRV